MSSISDHPKHGEQRGGEFTLDLPGDHVLRGGVYTCSVRWFSEWWVFWRNQDGGWVTLRRASDLDLAVADAATTAPPPAVTQAVAWLVYSREHNLWWRPNGAGYTPVIEQAGRYTQAKAEEIVRFAGRGRGAHREQGDEGPPEFMVPAPESLTTTTPRETFIEAVRRRSGRTGSAPSILQSSERGTV